MPGPARLVDECTSRQHASVHVGTYARRSTLARACARAGTRARVGAPGGSGKTVVGLATAERVVEAESEPPLIVVALPGRPLLLWLTLRS